MSRTDIDEDRREFEAQVEDPPPVVVRSRVGFVAALVAVALAAGAILLGVIASGAGDRPAAPEAAPTAEELVAHDFLTAFTSSDAARVAMYLADDASMPEEWWRDLKRFEAWRGVFLVEPCETMSTSVAGTNISCAFDLHAFGSDALGRAPFGLNVFTLRVDEGKVESFQASYNAASNGFLEQFDAVGSWVRANHPGDWEFMESHEDVSDADFPRWLQLWETRLGQYENRFADYLEATTGG